MRRLWFQLNQQNPKGATTTQDYSFLKEASPIYVTSLSSNNSTITSAAISTAKISNPQAKSPTVKSFSSPGGESFGNNQHPELHQTNSTSNQLLTTSIIRKPITSSTFDNKTVQNNISYIASASNPSSTTIQQLTKQVAGPSTAQGTLSTAIPLYDPSSDLIKNSASNVVNNNSSNFHNNINVLNNASSNQLPNNLDFDPIDGCTSYYSNNRTNEVLWLFNILTLFKLIKLEVRFVLRPNPGPQCVVLSCEALIKCFDESGMGIPLLHLDEGNFVD